MVREIRVSSLQDALHVPILPVAEVLRYLILSTGRSGSGFISAALTELGFHTGHEIIFHPNSVGTPINEMGTIHSRLVGESSWLATHWIPQFPENWEVLQLVRHPVRYINSLTFPPGYWAGAGGPYVEFKRAVLPQLPPGPEETCSALHWLWWNTIIETRVQPIDRFRLEDQAKELIYAVCDIFDEERSDEQLENAIKVGREMKENKHRVGTPTFQAEDLRNYPWFDALAKKAEEYGYDIDEPVA